jgi:glycosyltransferase involved in cell wall biosynthesis
MTSAAPTLPRLREAKATPGARPGAPLRVALVGNHPPRRCGIATYTRDVAAALRGAGHRLHLTAMTDPGASHDYGPAVDRAVAQASRSDHVAAGREIAGWDPDVVLVEHEFGIFGGPAGRWIADLIEAADAPAVVTLHTVLERPTPEQDAAMRAIEARAAALVVMAERGRRMLRARRPSGPPVEVIPHGAPDLPPAAPGAMRARLGWPERPTMLTFGLLSPGKGIETAIDALPAVLERVPGARYVLLGATHPHLVAREGETYREGLLARARALGVGDALHMIPRYVDDAFLRDALRAAEVYVTPYAAEAQITSGTLALALALGVPTVSTPYWHAREALTAAQLFPHGDAAALAAAASALLTDEGRRGAVSRETWLRARGTVWPAHAERLGAVLRDAARGWVAPTARRA